MSIAPNDQEETVEQEEKRAKAAFFVGLALSILFALLMAGSQLLAAVGGSPLELSFVSPMLFAAGVVGVILARRQLPMLSTGLMMLATYIGVGYLVSIHSGIGITLSIALTLAAGAIISQTWSRRLMGSGLVAITILLVGLIGMDLFWPTLRDPAPGFLQPFALILGAIILVGNVYYLFGRFSSSTYSLRTKLIASFLIVTLVPLGILAMLNNRTAQALLTDDANQRLFSAAAQTALSLDDFINNGLGTIRTEAGVVAQTNYYDAPGLLSAETEAGRQIGTLLQSFWDEDPVNILSYALLDINGRVVIQYPSISETLFEFDRDYFKTPLATGQAYVSSVEFSSGSDSGSLFFSAPILNNNNEVVGILRARYTAAIIQSLVARSTGLVGSQSFAVVFDDNTLHLAHGAAPETLYKLVAPVSQERYEELKAGYRLPDMPQEEISTNLPELAEQLANSAEEPYFGAVDVATGNRINQAAVVEMTSEPWQVGFFQPRDVFLAPIQGQTRRAVLLAGLIAAVVVVAAIGLSQILAGPITRLEAVAASVAEGNLTAQAEVESGDEIGKLAQSFNRMTTQIAELIGSLEQRVFDRTRALQTSTEVARRLSTILDRDQLLLEVVQQVQAAFDYYHVHIYIYNENSQKLEMAGGTGEAGKIMLANHHQIDMGKGLVGRAAQDNVVVLVPDVSREPGWLPNQLLPETRSEAAVPISLGDRLLGVLDVQHNIPGGLDEGDTELLQSVANQVAVALRNANLYEETRQRAAREALINEINQQIRRATDVDEAMKVAVRELGRAVGAPITTVRLVSERPANGRSKHNDE